MHTELKITHRNLKSDNILLNSDEILKISDFRWSNEVPEGSHVRTTVLQKDEYSGKKYIISIFIIQI